MRQASRFYAAAHEASQAYQFTRRLPWNERVNFAKVFGGIYAPEAYTSLSIKALSKLKAAHRYLYMRLTGWSGIESFDEEATVSSISIGSEDSNEEFYDTRSRWLYAHAAAMERTTLHQKVRGCGTLLIEHLAAAPHVEYQFRKARYRIQQTIERLKIDICLEVIRLSRGVSRAVGKVVTQEQAKV